MRDSASGWEQVGRGCHPIPQVKMRRGEGSDIAHCLRKAVRYDGGGHAIRSQAARADELCHLSAVGTWVLTHFSVS